MTINGENRPVDGWERIRAYYADLQAKCPHSRGFWREGMNMCLDCNAKNAVDVSGS